MPEMTEKKENALPEIPGFSWEETTYNLNDKNIPSFVVTWATDEGQYKAEFRKKLPLGQRIAAQEAFGPTETDEGRVAFLAAASLHEVSFPRDGGNGIFIMHSNPSRSLMLQALDKIDDAGLSAWIRAKTEMRPGAAEDAREKANVGN